MIKSIFLAGMRYVKAPDTIAFKSSEVKIKGFITSNNYVGFAVKASDVENCKGIGLVDWGGQKILIMGHLKNNGGVAAGGQDFLGMVSVDDIQNGGVIDTLLTYLYQGFKALIEKAVSAL